ncbi:MAG TPA: AIR synthase family protein [Candidatus Acidoferrum sp.]|nr:AIR synthase family protein [Candidatus Acidoferrum sp.]
MSQTLGKFNRSTLHRLIYSHLGRKRTRILVGPNFGVDNSVQRLNDGKVLIATCDPISFIPELGAQNSAWLSVNLLASDLTTSGVMPQYGIFDLNLPPQISNSEFQRYWATFDTECKKLGISIVGGHTGRYQGCDYTIIGGGVLYAVGEIDKYLTSSMARNGDQIILTKGAAVETTAILTRVFPKTVKRALGASLFEKAWESLSHVSTVKDAQAAVSIGIHEKGVTAMHDATEGGVISAAMELAYASNLGAELTLTNIRIPEETKEICKLFSIDPLRSLSEGSLVLTCSPEHTQRLLNRLRRADVNPQVIGRLTSKTHQIYALSKQRKRLSVQYPRFDPYWRAYLHATQAGWK